GERTIVATAPGHVFVETPAVVIGADGTEGTEQPIPNNYKVLVEEGQMVHEGDPIAQYGPRQLTAEASGHVQVRTHTVIHVRREQREEREYEIATTARLRIEPGTWVTAGQQLTEGSINPNRLLRIMGREAAQLYLLTEIQKVYRSQGVNINDKHI